ncbi:MAG: hypothetical protein FJ261_01865 [Planctomycetes bacterium]|nr:hypothetical protein [Planctomycetota bacterium]
MPSRTAIVLMAAMVAIGCGSDAPTHPVKGRVTLDGAPLENGSIRFSPTGEASPAGGEIKNGEYSLMAPPGESKVEITSTKVIGQRKAYNTPDSPMVDITKEVVPEKYNARSTLKIEVKAGSNSKDFELSTK